VGHLIDASGTLPDAGDPFGDFFRPGFPGAPFVKKGLSSACNALNGDNPVWAYQRTMAEKQFCSRANIFGHINPTNPYTKFEGMTWQTFRNYRYPLNAILLWVRPKNFNENGKS